MLFGSEYGVHVKECSAGFQVLVEMPCEVGGAQEPEKGG